MSNNEVTEWCPNCDHEVTMRWDIHADGYKAFCPHCGNVLMLCDECLHHEGKNRSKCDWDDKAGTCKHNPVNRREGVKE